MRAAYTGANPGWAGIWATAEGGYFQKYGLNVDLQLISGTGPPLAGMASGSLDIISSAASALIDADLHGGDFAILTAEKSFSQYKMVVDPSIKAVPDLKGKTVGVTAAGSADDDMMRRTLSGAGVDPKDVSFTFVNGDPAKLAALQAKNVQAVLFASPAEVPATRAGFVQLADLKQVVQTLGLEAPRAYIKANRPTVLNFLRANIEGGRRFRSDPTFARSVIQKYAKLDDPDMLASAWQDLSATMPSGAPYPILPGIQSILDTTGVTGHQPAEFVDMSLVKELDDAGFFK